MPAAIAGLLLRHLEDTVPLFTDVRFTAIILAIADLVLWLSDIVGSNRRELDKVTWIDVVLIPGVSRSGSTITAGLFLGLKREEAARFSFLMSLPITLGAIVFEMKDVVKSRVLSGAGSSPGVLLLGIIISAIAGFWATDFLLKYLKTRFVAIFAIWRIVVAFLVLVVLPRFALMSISAHGEPAAKTPVSQTRSVHP